MFEGIGNLQQSKGRSILVNFVVLSDIVIFLQENNQKYMFITPENRVRKDELLFLTLHQFNLIQQLYFLITIL